MLCFCFYAIEHQYENCMQHKKIKNKNNELKDEE